MNYRRAAAIPPIFALVCLAAGAALGQQFKLVGPKEASLNSPFEVSVEGLSLPLAALQTSPPQITWLVLGAETQVRQRMELVVTMEAGKPVWTASPYVTVTAGKAEKLYVVFTVDRAGEFAQQAHLEVACGPFPDPQPEPEPNPPLPPGVSRLYLIHESKLSTPQAAAVREDFQWKAEADKLGLQWRIADQDSALNLLPKVVQAGSAVGLPAVVYCNAAGDVLKTVKLPATPAAMLELVRAAKPKEKR